MRDRWTLGAVAFLLLGAGCEPEDKAGGLNSSSSAVTANDWLIGYGQNSPVFYFLDPLVTPAAAVDLARFDRSLTADLQVEACLPKTNGTCTLLQTLSSTTPNPSQLTLDSGDYIAVWKVAPSVRNQKVRLRVLARGLLLGSIERAPSAAAAVPVKFMVYHDPRIHAHVLSAKGKTASEVATTLRSEFQLPSVDIARLLAQEGFDARAIGAALRDGAHQDPTQTAAVFFGLGWSAETTADVLAHTLNQDAAQDVRALTAAGYPHASIYAALKQVFSLGYEAAAQVLLQAGYSPGEVARLVDGDARAYYTNLIRRLGPVFRLHPEERYLPSTVDYYLAHSHLTDSLGNSWSINAQSLYPMGHQAFLAGASDFHVNVDDNLKLPGDPANATSYVHVVRKDTYTDLQFWVFYPFNGPGTLRVNLNTDFATLYHPAGTEVSPMGEHFSDWEFVVLRIDNRTERVTEVQLSQHGEMHVVSGSDLSALDRDDNGHIAIYPSKNGHANMVHIGENPTFLISKDIDIPGFDVDLGVCLPEVCVPAKTICVVGHPCGTFLVDDWCCDEEVTTPGFCTPGACAKFSVPSLHVGNARVESLNRAAQGGLTLPAYADGRFNLVGIYSSLLGLDHLDPVDAVYGKHWIEFEGPWSQSWDLHLSHDRVAAILFEQFRPVMSYVCTGGVAEIKDAVKACKVVEYIVPDSCGRALDLYLGACRAAITPGIDQIPQSWIDSVTSSLVGKTAARPESPGVRYCEYQGPPEPANNGQWLYPQNPNDACQ